MNSCSCKVGVAFEIDGTDLNSCIREGVVFRLMIQQTSM